MPTLAARVARIHEERRAALAAADDALHEAERRYFAARAWRAEVARAEERAAANRHAVTRRPNGPLPHDLACVGEAPHPIWPVPYPPKPQRPWVYEDTIF